MSAAGAAVAALAMAAPAGALGVPTNVNYSGATASGAATANNLLVGSGSSTDYQMMIGLDSLFNQVPGCVITSGSVSGAPSKGSQELNYACEQNTTTGATLEQVPGNSYLDNPINDAAVEEAPMGSSNGIAQLELGRNQANTGIGTSFSATTQQQVSAINYARSSRDPSGSSDIQGLNFVAYAKDGVAPLIFTQYNTTEKATFAKAVIAAGLTTAQIQGIWNGTDYDWAQLGITGVTKSAPIFVYSAQEGSGTQATFKTFLGFDPSSSSEKVNCTDPAVAGSKATSTGYTVTGQKTPTAWPASSTLTGCQGPDVIFENEDASILRNGNAAGAGPEDTIATAWSAENNSASPVVNSIFFYSWGKFNLQCEGLKEQVQYLDKSKNIVANTKVNSDCGSAVPPTGTKLSLVPVNGVTANPTTILATSGTTYPIDRFLYNVYSNGSNTNIPEATAATLNYVSEVGFLCKPQTVDGTAEGTLPTNTETVDANTNDITDPATGLWYHDEIFNTILDNGFLPVNAVGGSTIAATTDGPALPNENAAGATHTAYSLLSTGSPAYGASYLGTDAPGQSSNTSIPTGSSMPGYCILSTTDGNTNS